MTDWDVPVLVVGAGPTGLMAAGELARHGTQVRIIDRAEAPATTSRALITWSRTLEMYDDIGLTEPVLQTGRIVKALNAVYSQDNHVRVELLGLLDGPETHSEYPYGFTISQHDTERILTDHLAELGVKVDRGMAVTDVVQDDDGVTVTVHRIDSGTEQIRAGWVIGADGAHSKVREATGIPFEGATYHDEFIMADAELDWELPDDELYVFISKAGIFAAFNMPGEHRFRIFGNVKPKDDGPSAEYSEPTHDEFQAMIDARIPYPTRVVKEYWVSRYRIHRRGVPRYRDGRVFLAGDAAHVHSPAGAQGMNTGLQDAYNLAWKLALIERGVATGSAADRLLNSYQADRHPIGQRLLKTTDRMFSVISGQQSTMKFIREHVLPGVGSRVLQAKSSRRFLAGMLSELHLSYPESPLNAETGGHWGDAVAPGERAREVDLGEGRMYDVLRGTHHTVLLFTGWDDGAANAVELTRLAERIETTYPGLVVARVISAGRYADHPKMLADPDRTAHRQYGVENGSAFVVRPDKYIGYRGTPVDADDILADLARRLT